MTSVAAAIPLKCPSCSGQDFHERFGLTWNPNGGTVRTLKGYTCQQCNAVVDPKLMLDRARLLQKRAELAEVNAEIEALTPPVLASDDAPTPPRATPKPKPKPAAAAAAKA